MRLDGKSTFVSCSYAKARIAFIFTLLASMIAFGLWHITRWQTTGLAQLVGEWNVSSDGPGFTLHLREDGQFCLTTAGMAFDEHGDTGTWTTHDKTLRLQWPEPRVNWSEFFSSSPFLNKTNSFAAEYRILSVHSSRAIVERDNVTVEWRRRIARPESSTTQE